MWVVTLHIQKGLHTPKAEWVAIATILQEDLCWYSCPCIYNLAVSSHFVPGLVCVTKWLWEKNDDISFLRLDHKRLQNPNLGFFLLTCSHLHLDHSL